MILSLNMCILMGKRLADFKTVVPNYKVFGLRKQKTGFLKKNRVWCNLFMKSKCIWLQTALPGLKNTKQLKFC